MVPAPENVQIFQWDEDRKVHVLMGTRKPTFHFDITTSSNVHDTHHGNDYKFIGFCAPVIMMCICFIIFSIWKFCHCGSYRPSRSVSTINTSEMANSYRRQTDRYSDTAIFSLLELHTFGLNMSQYNNNGFSGGNMAHDQPPNYFDVTLINSSSSRESTNSTEIPESPPPNYEECK